MEELVSVVIPTHYRHDRLVKAVESAKSQTWTNIEIIIVSDGYDPSTESVIKELKKEDSRIRFFSYEPSQGGNHARNVGIQNSKGDYIAFLDDDDIWYPSKIEKQMKLISKSLDIGLVGCGINVINTRLNKTYSNVFTYCGDLSKKILYRNIIGSTSCVMVKKEALEKCGFFDENMPARQDHDLWIRICQEYKTSCVEEILLDYYVYDTSGKGKQISKSMDKFISSNSILLEKYQELYNKLSRKEYDILLSIRFCGIAARAHEIGDLYNCRKYAKLSIERHFSAKGLFYLLFSWIKYDSWVKLKSIMK